MAGRRDKKGRFQPGQSGNPSGRSKATQEVLQLCLEISPAAIERLWQIGCKSEDHKAAVRAIETILDRGLGKVKQVHDVSVIRDMPDEELRSRALEVLRRQSVSGGAVDSMLLLGAPVDD